MHTILIGAPVRQESAILREFLRGLAELDTTGLQVEFAFVDDNVEAESTTLLQEFAQQHPTLLLDGGEAPEVYRKDEYGHVWNDELIWKVARFKDTLLDHARRRGHDGVFLVDSDLVLHPRLLHHLIRQGVDVVSEVFWTRWAPGMPDRPQVWLRDQYTMHHQRRDEVLTQEEIDRRKQQFFQELLRPGLHRVGGLGACTLLSRRALLAGVNFQAIPNLGLWGEDRHFCIRAAVLGLSLHADTCYPPLHVYRQSELPRVEVFRGARPLMQRRVQALQAFRNGITAWGTTHHATTDGREGLAAFSPGMQQNLAASASDRVALAKRMRSVTRTHVVWQAQKDLDDGAMQIGGTLVREGSHDGTPFRDDFGVLATMRDERGDGDFRITDLQLQRVNEPLTVPVVRKTHGNRVLLSMLVRDEAGRFLREVLTEAARYVDEVLIVDDGSTDASVAVCHEVLRSVPHRVVSLGRSQFHDEHRLRRLQWELARAQRPDWILCLDADEMFESRMAQALRGLVDQDQYDAIAFRLFDFWDQDHYRDDALWRAHRTFRHFLVRNLPDLDDAFRTTAQHCGRWPLAVDRLRTATSDVRLKHFGWALPDDRVRKYERYRQLDPEGRHGSLAQYESILDPSPNLVKWTEAP
ncbi:MAG: glycosyltransferase [Planctomycetota bacterium]